MKVEIFGSNQCPNCTEAYNVAQTKTDDVKKLTLGEDFTLPELFEKIGNPVRTFPQIFVNDEYIGSLNEFVLHLEKIDAEGDLDSFEL